MLNSISLHVIRKITNYISYIIVYIHTRTGGRLIERIRSEFTPNREHDLQIEVENVRKLFFQGDRHIRVIHNNSIYVYRTLCNVASIISIIV